MTTQAAAQTTEHNDETLFEANTRDVVDLKRLIKTIDALVDEVPVSVGQDGVRFRTADRAMISLIDVVLKPAFFGGYEYNRQKPNLFLVDVGALKDRVSEAKKGDRLKLIIREATGAATPVIDVKVWSDGITSTFTLPTSEADEVDVPSTEDLEFSGSALVAVPMFRAAIQKMGESTQFTLREDRFVMASDVDNQVARVRFPDGSDHLHAVRLSEGPVCSMYSTEYLEIVKGLKHTVQRLRLQFGTDHPLKLGTSNDRFELSFVLAPRIEEE